MVLPARRARAGPTPLLQRVRVLVWIDEGRREAARELLAGLGPPAGYLDHWIDAVARMQLSPADGRAWQDYLRRLSLALRLAPRPQLGLYCSAAFAAIECGTHGERDELARALLALWPQSPNAHKVAGMVLEHVDDARAEAAYRRALELWPEFGHARMLRARLLLRTGAAAPAAAELRVLADGESAHHAPTHELLVEALERAGQPAAAAAARAQAAALRAQVPNRR
jgi:predicted Zn-dependent protease